MPNSSMCFFLNTAGLMFAMRFVSAIQSSHDQNHSYVPDAMSSAAASDSTDTNMVVESGEGHTSLLMAMDEVREVLFMVTLGCTNRSGDYVVSIETQDADVVRVPSLDYGNISCINTGDAVVSLQAENKTSYFKAMRSQREVYVTLQSGNIGKTSIVFVLRKNTNVSTLDEPSPIVMSVSYDVTVVRVIRPIDSIFNVLVYLLQIFATIGFGVALSLKTVKENLKRPIAPGIGFFGQYVVMPLIAFGLATVITKDNPAVSLGIFVTGCCPGGFASNMYSFLLDGDISLSITMTTISTIAAMGMLPLWIYTLGSMFLEEKEAAIPFSSVAISLAVIIGPLAVGVFIKYKFPKIARIIAKILKPIVAVFVLIFLAVAIYSHLYVFRLFEIKVVLAGCLLPYIGYLLGGIIAFIARQSWTQIKTIAIETGMQNNLIAYLLMKNSFPAPIGDMASVAPVATGVLTPIPVLIVTVIYFIYKKYKWSKEEEARADVDKEADDTEIEVQTKLMS